jgi:hypothetical protein
MKLRPLLLLSVLLLSSCSSETSPVNPEDGKLAAGKVPAACEITEVINAFDAQVPGSKYVPTDWQPMPDTDLYAALNNQGIACTYGIQVAEVGGTILWASNSDNVWEVRKASWIKEGETSIDLPGIEESEAFILQEGTAADEMHLWQINILIRGVWIQIGASFLQNLDEALPIVKASVAAIDH